MTTPPHRAERPEPDRPARLRALDARWRAACYLGAAQLHLRENALLRRPLEPGHVKRRILGHWGTQPGLSLVYAHLERLVADEGIEALLVTGPGHGAPAIFANLWLEGALEEHGYPRDGEGLERLARDFSWPHGLPSHLRPFTPGQIQEGGELGYALAHAAGAAFDAPERLVACVIGDGEAETGALAASWQSARFLDPLHDGAVLPILHLNGYKIGNPAVLARIPDDDLDALLRGGGWRPIRVEGDEPERVHERLWDALDEAWEELTEIRRAARDEGRRTGVRRPAIVLRTPKGWTGPVEVGGRRIEGTARSHGTPLSDPRGSEEELEALRAWLEGYRPEELFDEAGRPRPAVLSTLPPEALRLGRAPAANGGALLRPLPLPPAEAHALDPSGPGEVTASATRVAGGWLRDLLRATEERRDWRLVCPDELGSNRLDAVLEATPRGFALPPQEGDEDLAPGGRVLEVLSEHLCQGWLEGYLTTGRHGLFACYEAFTPIVDSMAHQFAKWLTVARRTPWREPVSPLVYLLTSHSWRQDHNGYSHQGPGFIDSLLTNRDEVVRIWLPPDANSLLAALERAYEERDAIVLVIASKQDMPQWFGLDEARERLRRGAARVGWASADGPPDLVLGCAGDVPTEEAFAAAALLRRDVPELALQVVNVVAPLALAPDHPHAMSGAAFRELFPDGVETLFAFHGYPRALHAILHDRPEPARFHVRGYREEGSTTTPMDMRVLNGLDRWHLALDALRLAGVDAPAAAARYRRRLDEHREAIEREGVDPDWARTWRTGPA